MIIDILRVVTLHCRVAIVLAMSTITGTVACGGDPILQHPIVEQEQRNAVTYAAQPSAELRRLAARLDNTTQIVSIGTISGAQETIFGAPVDAEVLPNGDVLIVDAMAGSIRTYTSSGEYRHTLVGKGGGPSELADVLAVEMLAPDSAGAHLIMVAGRSLVKIFRMANDGVELQRTFRAPEIPLPSAVCKSQNKLVVRAAYSRREDLITAINTTNGERQTFGSGYSHGGPLAREDLSVGPIVCLGDGRVIAAYTFLPRIVAYDPSGAVVWETILPEFSPLHFVETPRADGPAGFTYDFTKPGDRVMAFHRVAEFALLVQVGHLSASTPEAPSVQRVTGRDTYLIDVSTGKGVQLKSSLPHILAVTDSTVWAADEAREGYPRVVGLRF